MTTQRARLRIEFKNGNFMLGKVTDIETGIAIPVKSIKIDVGVHNWRDGVWATIVVPVEELELDGVLTQIETEAD